MGAATRRAVVIGAGFGGLAVAARLAARGWEVTLCEKNDAPGGRARVVREQGYTFDLGPSVITGPSLLRELWSACGSELSRDVDLLPVDPSYRFVFDDGTSLELSANAEAMAAEVSRLAPGDLPGWVRYRAHVERFWERSVKQVMHAPMQHLADLLPFAGGMIAGGGFSSMDALVRWHVRDRKLVRALRFHPTFVGASPWAPGSAIYSAIQGLEWEEGVWFPRGGTNALVSAMEALGRRRGAAYRYGAAVRTITVDRGRATGVILESGERLEADAVVSNADATWTYTVLEPEGAREPLVTAMLQRARYTEGLFVFYFGTTKTYPGVAHHSVILDRELPSRWNPVGPTMFEPFTYLHRPTATDPSLAPEGCDAFYALRAVPNLQGIQDWRVEAERQREILLRALERTQLPGLREHIAVERSMNPRDFREQLLTEHGAGFGLAPTLLQSAPFRPHARSEALPGLYLVGEGTHPGPGVPAVISSARIVDRLLHR